MRKPNSETFEWVLKDAKILANETLFIDDSIQHINNAKKLVFKHSCGAQISRLKKFFFDKFL